MTHRSEHPSPLRPLPSSQSSVSKRRPSPQRGSHAPSSHSGSRTHWKQPSNGTSLTPSSQPSLPSGRPSPHTVSRQSSPGVRQTNPASTPQLSLQPSPASALPSSH